MGFISFILFFVLFVILLLIVTGFSFLARLWYFLTGRGKNPYGQAGQYAQEQPERQAPKQPKGRKKLGDVKDVDYEKVED